MPMLQPKPTEEKQDFLSRFMSNEEVTKEYPEESQRITVAEQAWRDRKKSFSDILVDMLTDRTEKVDGVEILNTYGNSLNLDLTEKDLDEFTETFNEFKEKYRPNIKIDHSAHQAILREIFEKEDIPLDSEIPNIGFINKMYRKGKSLFADIVEIPNKIKPLLFAGQFKGVSPEFYMNFRGTGKKFIEAVALTNYPRLKHAFNLSELNPEVASGDNRQGLGFSGKLHIIGEQKMDKTVNVVDETQIDEKLTKFSDNLFDKFKGMFKKETTTEDKVSMSDVEDIISKKMSEINEVHKVEMNELNKKLVEKDELLKTFSEQIESVKQSTRNEKVDAICQKAKLKGVKPKDVDIFQPLLASELADEKFKFSKVIDNEVKEIEMKVSEVIENFFKSNEGTIDFSDRTRGVVIDPLTSEMEDRASLKMSEIEKLTDEYMKKGMSEFDALNRASDEVYGG